MPEKRPTITFDAIMKDLKAEHFAPIYILMGEESYYIDQISEYIQEYALTPDEQAFNQTVVFGADTNAAKISDLCMSYPMMANRRVVIVKEAQGLRSFDKLEKYAEKPLASTVLVICYKNGSINRRQRFVSNVERNGVVFESKKLKDFQLPSFVREYLKKKNVSIDDKSASMLADHVGADLNRMMSELDKLLISLPEDDRRVTPAVVEKNVGVSKDFNTFELRNAIVNKDVFKANQIIKYFNSNPKAGSLYAFLPLLFGFFQNLLIAYYAPNKTDPQSLSDYLGLRSAWGTKEYLAGMRNYTGRKTLQILEKLREIDAKSKGLDNPNTDAGDLMKELIFFILH